MSSIMEVQQKVIRNLFNNDSLEINRSTSAKDVDGWDSMMHIQIITSLEKEFKIRFALGELQALKNVGDMEDLITKKTNAL